MDFEKLTIIEASKLLKEKKITVKELIDFYVSNAKAKNKEYNIYLEIFDDIDDQVKKAQEIIDRGEIKELTGIPFAIKDNIVIDGRKASGGSKILENYTATYNSTAVQKLIDQGAVFIGRANMDEFAMGGSTENSAYGPTKNTYDIDRVAGGSSGGSAVAVSSGAALAALGSDTGGSIRQPAAFNGVVGLKPTYGAVSRYGLMAMASSLDVVGPITKNVADSEIVFNVIKGIDPKDSTTVEGDGGGEVKTIGVPRSFLKEGVDPDVLDNFNDSLKKLESDGYKVVDIDLPSLEYALAVYYIIVPAEVSSNMARYDGVKFGNKIEGKDLIDDYFKTRGGLLGEEVRRRIILGTYVLSAGYSGQYYNKAWAVRSVIRNDFNKAFETVDIIAMPTTPGPAFKIGEKTDDPLKMYLEDIFTVPANLTGIPAISIPSGKVERDGKELPVGIQFIAPHLGEAKLFQVGQKFERID